MRLGQRAVGLHEPGIGGNRAVQQGDLAAQRTPLRLLVIRDDWFLPRAEVKVVRGGLTRRRSVEGGPHVDGDRHAQTLGHGAGDYPRQIGCPNQFLLVRLLPRVGRIA